MRVCRNAICTPFQCESKFTHITKNSARSFVVRIHFSDSLFSLLRMSVVRFVCLSRCVFYLCWTNVAKHNKSPKRMQSSIQCTLYTRTHTLSHAYILLTNDAVTIMPVTQMMLALKFPVYAFQFIPKHK